MLADFSLTLIDDVEFGIRWDSGYTIEFMVTQNPTKYLDFITYAYGHFRLPLSSKSKIKAMQLISNYVSSVFYVVDNIKPSKEEIISKAYEWLDEYLKNR